MFACAALAACTNDELVGDNDGNKVGSDQKAYLAVNITTTGSGSRALAGFEDGTGNESVVSAARFYFFDANGNAFTVNENSTNYIDVTKVSLTSDETPADNVESTVTMLVIDGGTGVPAQVVTVLNPASVSLGASSKSLSELTNTVTAYASTGNNEFVMSNSVYADGANVMNAVKLEPKNICTTREDALDAPVSIYVERVLAKVAATSTNENNTFETGVTVGETAIYARIKGFQVTATKPTSYLIKNIEATWTADGLGFNWNDASNHRSYWATSTDGEVLKNISWVDAETNGLNSVYCQENTSGEKTQLLVAAELQYEDGRTVEIAEWFGVQYVDGEAAVKRAMLQTLTDYWYSTGENKYSQLTEDDLVFSKTGDIASYQVKAGLAEGEYSFFTKNGDNYTAVEKSVVETAIANLAPAMIYKSGMTYYYTSIEHSGATGTGQYGIVRNHSYKISISGISGLGTPVYDPDTDIVPTIPADQKTYIAATVNVLAWKIVTQDVVLGE